MLHRIATGATVSAAGTAGIGASFWLQVLRRAAVTAVAVITTSSAPSLPV